MKNYPECKEIKAVNKLKSWCLYDDLSFLVKLINDVIKILSEDKIETSTMHFVNSSPRLITNI